MIEARESQAGDVARWVAEAWSGIVCTNLTCNQSGVFIANVVFSSRQKGAYAFCVYDVIS